MTRPLPHALVLLALSALALVGCSAPRKGVVRLWEGEKQWVRTESGWVRGVVVEGTRRAILPNGAGECWRAVAYPLDGDTLLALDQGDGPVEYLASGPMALSLELRRPAASLSIGAGRRVLLADPRVVPPGRQGRRCMLILADALRADHADARHMTELAEVFRGGLEFVHAYSPESWTLPSMASLFTGKVPAALRHPDGTLISLPSGETTLAERLSAQGWIGAAVVANYTLNHENGYSQGFDWFTAPAVVEAGQAPPASWVNERALAIAQRLEDEDLFLYLHYMDLHEPYVDHERGAVVKLPAPGGPVPAEEAEAVRSAYASSARHLDQEVRALLDRLPAPEWVVLTADHGELLGEHGLWGHGPTLYNEGIHVPLWIASRRWGAGRVDYPVSTRRLAGLLAGESESLEPERDVTAETFAHGPPRFASFFRGRKAVLFARPLEPVRSSNDPLEVWLRDHIPPVRFSDGDEGAVLPLGPDDVQEVLRALIGQFQGFRRGVHLLFKGEGPFRARVTGAGRGEWVWGEGEELGWTREGEGTYEVFAGNASPFCLFFFPAAGDRAPQVELLQGRLVITPAQGGPRSFGADGAYLWLDSGRPPSQIEGMEETLRRLRSLGYIR